MIKHVSVELSFANIWLFLACTGSIYRFEVQPTGWLDEATLQPLRRALSGQAAKFDAPRCLKGISGAFATAFAIFRVVLSCFFIVYRLLQAFYSVWFGF